MRVVVDIEADSLKPTKIWCIVLKDIDTHDVTTFDPTNLGDFLAYSKRVTLWIGHNILGYDIWALNDLVPNCSIDPSRCIDTLVVSRLVDYRLDGGHSLAAWGERLGKPKHDFNDFSKFSQEMLDYCIQDVEVTYKLYKHFESIITDPQWRSALRTEHDIAILCREMHTNGFSFNLPGAQQIHVELTEALASLRENFQESFPPRAKLIREVVPRGTKSGTLHAGDFRWVDGGDLTPYSIGAPFSRITWEDFNPGSPKQIVERFYEFGWAPYVKTDGHVDTEREFKRLERELRNPRAFLPAAKVFEYRTRLVDLEEKLRDYEVYGWKICEENLETLPETSPEAAWQLIKWKFLEKRRQTLEEWFAAYDHSDGRIHGNFNGIGTWTHRFSHNNPNMGNVPSVDSKYNSQELKDLAKYYGKQLRALWTVPHGRRLVGVDAEGIQLRILAHYINDHEFTTALVSGDKELGTDVHTLNAEKLGIGAAARPKAKTFIYAFLLGAGIPKLARILDLTNQGAQAAYDNFLEATPGLARLKREQVPEDSAKGYFIGLDGRLVPCDNDHLMLAGYLQNGEAIVMKRATLKWRSQLLKEKVPFKLVNYVHDEWQTEVPDDDDVANYVASVQMKAIEEVGVELNLNCPLAGSKSLGYNWYETH